MERSYQWAFQKIKRVKGILYKTRNFCPSSTLRSLYHSLFNSRVCYGLPVWGYANEIYLDKIIKAQKKAIRAITFSKYSEHVTPLLKKQKILNIKDLRYQKTASLLWDLEKEVLPPSLSAYFTKANSTHNFNTRFASSGKYVIRNSTNSFQSIGAKISNVLTSTQAFSATNKKTFLANIKEELLSNY